MGERLVIKFQKNGDTILSTYQHWNGYTRGALYTVINCIEKIEKDKSQNDVVKLAKSVVDSFNEDFSGNVVTTIQQLLNPEDYCGAGLDVNDYDVPEIREEFNLPLCGSRNVGIVSVTPGTIEDTIGWGEEFATINLDDLTTNIRELLWWDPEPEENNEKSIVNLPDEFKDLKTSYFTKDQLKSLLKIFNKELENGYPYFAGEEGYYSVIE